VAVQALASPGAGAPLVDPYTLHLYGIVQATVDQGSGPAIPKNRGMTNVTIVATVLHKL